MRHGSADEAAQTQEKIEPARPLTSSGGGLPVKAHVDEVNWYEAGAGYVYADVRSRAASDVMLEAGPRAKRFYARAVGFELLGKAQLHLIARRSHVGAGQGKPIDLPTL